VGGVAQTRKPNYPSQGRASLCCSADFRVVSGSCRYPPFLVNADVGVAAQGPKARRSRFESVVFAPCFVRRADAQVRFRVLSDASFEGVAIAQTGMVVDVNANFAASLPS
jgi:hypothetical protein